MVTKLWHVTDCHSVCTVSRGKSSLDWAGLAVLKMSFSVKCQQVPYCSGSEMMPPRTKVHIQREKKNKNHSMNFECPFFPSLNHLPLWVFFFLESKFTKMFKLNKTFVFKVSPLCNKKGGVDSLKILRKGQSVSQYNKTKSKRDQYSCQKKMFSLKGKKKTLILLSHKFVWKPLKRVERCPFFEAFYSCGIITQYITVPPPFNPDFDILI